MIKALQVEYHKIKHFNALKYIFGAYMLAVPGLMCFINWIFSVEPELKMVFTNKELFSFPNIWSFITFTASFLNILLAVLVVIITTNELEFKTMRQNIIDGLTKRQFIFGKFAFVLCLSVIATFYTGICGFFIAGFSHGFADAFENIHLIGLYFIQTLGYFSFAFLFSLIVKRPALSIITFIIYFPVETIIGNLISVKMYSFFPLKIYDDLTPIPFFKAILDNMSDKNNVFLIETPYKVLLSLVYISLSFVACYYLIKKKDV